MFGVCLEMCRAVSGLLCCGSGISAFVLLCLSVSTSSQVLLLFYLMVLAASVCVLHPLQVPLRELATYKSHLSASVLPWFSKGVCVGLYSVAHVQCCLVLPPLWQSLVLLLGWCFALLHLTAVESGFIWRRLWVRYRKRRQRWERGRKPRSGFKSQSQFWRWRMRWRQNARARRRYRVTHKATRALTKKTKKFQRQME